MVNLTNHVKSKMSQRGINRELLEIVLVIGLIKQDKVILNRKRCDKFIKKVDKHLREVKYSGNQLHHKNLITYRSKLIKIRDKGGITLVIMAETLITTYNTDIRLKRKRRYKGKK